MHISFYNLTCQVADQCGYCHTAFPCKGAERSEVFLFPEVSNQFFSIHQRYFIHYRKTLATIPSLLLLGSPAAPRLPSSSVRRRQRHCSDICRRAGGAPCAHEQPVECHQHTDGTLLGIQYCVPSNQCIQADSTCTNRKEFATVKLFFLFVFMDNKIAYLICCAVQNIGHF